MQNLQEGTCAGVSFSVKLQAFFISRNDSFLKHFRHWKNTKALGVSTISRVACNTRVCPFHFAEIFRFVEIQFSYCLYLPKGLEFFNPFSSNFTIWSNTLRQFVGNLPTNCLSVFDHFVGLVLKGLTKF